MHTVKWLSKDLNPSLCMLVVYPDPRTGMVCVSLFSAGGGGAVLWEKTLVLCRMDGRKLISPVEASKSPWDPFLQPLNPFICARVIFKSRELEGAHVTSLIYYCSSCSSNSNHWLLFCLSPHLHQRVVGKELNLASDQPHFVWQLFLGNSLQLFSSTMSSVKWD